MAYKYESELLNNSNDNGELLGEELFLFCVLPGRLAGWLHGQLVIK